MTMIEESPTGAPSYKWVGSRSVRPDGLDKVTGKARFGADLTLPGMLEGAVARSPHAHARIVSIDTSAAEAMAGVHAVITAADLPDLAEAGAKAGAEAGAKAGAKAGAEAGAEAEDERERRGPRTLHRPQCAQF